MCIRQGTSYRYVSDRMTSARTYVLERVISVRSVRNIVILARSVFDSVTESKCVSDIITSERSI